MTASSVNLVSRRPARPDGEPLTWGFNVSEGGLEPPRRGNFPESGKFHVTRIPDWAVVFKYFAGVYVASVKLSRRPRQDN